MTERGAPVVYFNSYKFNKHRETGVKTRWWCSTHRGRGCSASITTIGDKVVKITNKHRHEPKEFKEEQNKLS